MSKSFSPVEGLPAEIKINVLQQCPDTGTLHAICYASYLCYQAYKSLAQAIYTEVLEREIDAYSSDISNGLAFFQLDDPQRFRELGGSKDYQDGYERPIHTRDQVIPSKHCLALPIVGRCIECTFHRSREFCMILEDNHRSDGVSSLSLSCTETCFGDMLRPLEGYSRGFRDYELIVAELAYAPRPVLESSVDEEKMAYLCFQNGPQEQKPDSVHDHGVVDELTAPHRFQPPKSGIYRRATSPTQNDTRISLPLGSWISVAPQRSLLAIVHDFREKTHRYGGGHVTY